MRSYNLSDLSIVVTSLGGVAKITAWLEAGHKRFVWFFSLIFPQFSGPFFMKVSDLWFPLKEKTLRKMSLCSPSWIPFSQQRGESWWHYLSFTMFEWSWWWNCLKISNKREIQKGLCAKNTQTNYKNILMQNVMLMLIMMMTIIWRRWCLK